jgi:hypothetical protein
LIIEITSEFHLANSDLQILLLRQTISLLAHRVINQNLSKVIPSAISAESFPFDLIHQQQINIPIFLSSFHNHASEVPVPTISMAPTSSSA